MLNPYTTVFLTFIQADPKQLNPLDPFKAFLFTYNLSDIESFQSTYKYYKDLNIPLIPQFLVGVTQDNLSIKTINELKT